MGAEAQLPPCEVAVYPCRAKKSVGSPLTLLPTSLTLVADADDNRELGSNWQQLDMVAVDSGPRESGLVPLDLEGECFDLVICTNLDRVSHPFSLAEELWRILKPGAQICCQVAINEPPPSAEGNGEPTQYWQMIPFGLRLFCERFDQILCSAFRPREPEEGIRQTVSIFYGLKPVDDRDNESY